MPDRPQGEETPTTRTALFVCTGNTCRSPMAEALARDLQTRAGGAPIGWSFLSAGIAAGPGAPASRGALQAMAELGVDISHHQSRPLDVPLLTAVDRVFCLSSSHLEAIRHGMPDIGDKAELLDPEGGDVPDPFGQAVETYRVTRDAIRRFLEARLAELAVGA